MQGVAAQTAFEERGYLILRGAVPETDCERMGDVVWRAMAGACGMRREAPETWRSGLVVKLGRRMAPDALDALAAPRVRAAVDALLGAGTWDLPRVRGQALPNFPRGEPWFLPGRMWHLDFPVRPLQRHPFAVKLLCLLAPVAPRGGATLLLEGSQRMVQALAAGGFSGQSADVRRRLAQRHAWLSALFSGDHPESEADTFMGEPVAIDGVPLRVVEFTGGAGDVLLFHPWLLHNMSPNARRTPRLQIGQSLVTRDGLAVYAPVQRRAAAG